MAHPFELEGIEIRIQQKVLAEFVEQSTEIEVDYAVNPKIYFSEDGKLYFFDQTMEKPISLDQVETFYNRIRFDEGELRFYTEDRSTYVPLSFFSDASKTYIDKPNALITNDYKLFERSPTFDSTKQFMDVIKQHAPSNLETEGDLYAALASITNDYLNSLFGGEIVAEETTVFNKLVSLYTNGVSAGGGNGSVSRFNMDDILLNKHVAINDVYYVLSKSSYDHQQQTSTEEEETREFGSGEPIFLEGELFATLVNESAKILQAYDGLGTLLNKYIGKSGSATEGEESSSLSFDVKVPLESGGFTGISQITDFFTVDAVEHAGCSDANSINLGSFSEGNIAFKWVSSVAGSLSGGPHPGPHGMLPYGYSDPLLVNQSIGSLACQGYPSIGVVETTYGDLSFDTHEPRVFKTAGDGTDVKVWYRSPDEGQGVGKFEYVWTGKVKEVTNNFILSVSGNVDWTTETDEVEQSWNYDPAEYEGAPSRIMLGYFEPGTISFEYVDGFGRPNFENETIYNEVQTYEANISGGNVDVEFGYINSNLGPIDFETSTSFEITEPTLVEVWYEDYDHTDNDGQLKYKYKYLANDSVKNEIEDSYNSGTTDTYSFGGAVGLENEIALSVSEYAMDHMNRIVSFCFKTMWYDSLLKEFAADGLVLFNKFIQPITSNIQISDYVDRAGTRFIESSTKNTLKEFITEMITDVYNEKVYYEGDELTDEERGIVDFRNYFIYSAGAGLAVENMVNRNLNLMNNVWMDFGELQSVIPKSSNGYATAIMSNFNVDYTPGIPCQIQFRLYDSTSDKELDRVDFSFLEVNNIRYQHTATTSDMLLENKTSLNVQMAYFGPLEPVLCDKKSLTEACQDKGRDVFSHVLLKPEEVFTDDAADDETFKIITDRLAAYLAEQGEEVSETETVAVATPRVIRVQWKMSFPEEQDSVNAIKYDLGRMQFDSYAPQNDTALSINVYSFSDTSNIGKTSQGVVKFDGRTKRIQVSGDAFANLPDAKYSISLSCSKNINVWYENKNISGFEVVAEKEFEGEVSWIIIRERKVDTGSKSDEAGSDDAFYFPPCVIDRVIPYSAKTDYEILYENGYFNSYGNQAETEETELDTTSANISGSGNLSLSLFIDPNGPRCSQDCVDDCPEDYMCSPDCYTASLTESGCGCCQCIEDNDCPPGFACNELNECVEI